MNPPPNPDSSDPMDAPGLLRERLTTTLARWREPDEVSPRPSDMDFMSWLLEAARLAALGDDEILREWPALASRLGIDVRKTLEIAAMQGIDRIESLAGRDLAEEIGRAEDAACLDIMEPRITDLLGSTLSRRWLNAWTDAASRIPLDEEAIRLVQERRRRWPLSEQTRLPAVEMPLGRMDLVLGAGPRPSPRRLVPAFAYVEEAALFDDGRPTPGMIRRFATRRGATATASGRWLRADAELDPYWQVTLGLQAPGVGVRSIRIGPVAMGLHPDAAGPSHDHETNMLWSASLNDLPLSVRTRVVCGDISILTDEGDRFLL